MNLTSVSFVIPMYNEKEAISDTIEKLIPVAESISKDYEIVIADDASLDGSCAVVEAISKKNSNIRLVRLEKNTKFGGALNLGIKSARKEIIIYTDSDLPVEFSDLREALKLIDKNDIVTGYSKIKKGETVKRIIISKVYNFLIQLFFNTGIKDINSGFKIYKRKVFKEIELASNSPFIDVEIFVKAMRKGFTVGQYPLIFRNRKKGKSNISRPDVIFATFFDMLKFRIGG